MSYPNSALSAWQMTLVAVVAVACLAAWLIAVYVAAREPRDRDGAATASSTDTTESVAAGSIPASATGEPEPTQQAGSQMAA